MTLYLIARGRHSSLMSDTPVIRAEDIRTAKNAADMLRSMEARDEERDAALKTAIASAEQAASEAAERAARARYAEAFADLEAKTAELDEDARRRAETLAVAIVRQIAPGFAEDRLVAALATRALAASGDDRPVEVHVHPGNAATVQERLRGQARCLRIVADAALSPHDCLIVGPHGRVDAGLESQLCALETAFAERAQEAGQHVA
ncbi:MAG: FliH/SctL family protein [Pseudomonadota bacterium]